MTDTVIQVDELGKRYQIGAHTNGAEGLRHKLNDLITSPFRRLRTPNSTLRTPHSQPFWALRGVSFEVKRGEVLGIIGRNGAGKSTLLKILSRITEPTTGCARIRGRVASLLEVGTGFHPELTGRENVFLNGAILGMSREEIKRKFDEIVAFAEVEQFLDTPVKRYSSGMYVRLAFAVAAHLDPEILIVDEVLAVGDAQFQKKCLGKMNSAALTGRTVLFVSHNMAAVKSLCSSAIRLSSGRVVEAGDTSTVIKGYIHEYSTAGATALVPDHAHLVKSPLQIRTVEVLDSTKRPCDNIPFGEEMFIRLGVQTSEQINQVRIGIGVYALGVRLCTLHTPSIDLRAENHVSDFTCRIPANALLPNFYSLHVGAHSAETGRDLDWVADAADFRVESVNVSGGTDHDSRDWGLMNLQATWESVSLAARDDEAANILPPAKFEAGPQRATDIQ